MWLHFTGFVHVYGETVLAFAQTARQSGIFNVGYVRDCYHTRAKDTDGRRSEASLC